MTSTETLTEKALLKGAYEVKMFVRRTVFEFQGCRNSRGGRLSRQILDSAHEQSPDPEYPVKAR